MNYLRRVISKTLDYETHFLPLYWFVFFTLHRL